MLEYDSGGRETTYHFTAGSVAKPKTNTKSVEKTLSFYFWRSGFFILNSKQKVIHKRTRCEFEIVCFLDC